MLRRHLLGEASKDRLLPGAGHAHSWPAALCRWCRTFGSAYQADADVGTLARSAERTAQGCVSRRS